MENPDEFLSTPAKEIYALSLDRWGRDNAVVLAGHSEAFVATLNRLIKFAAFREPVLITGESGSGKECVAKACHVLSDRKEAPFVAVNCPQYQDGSLTGSELFGHTKGAFTGATGDRKGDFENASGGTLFLDEVADLSMNAQKMLLRALAEQEFKPVGSPKTVKVDVRMVSATNRPLNELILSNDFREDLYFRLRFFPVALPPLRERDDDALVLVEYFLLRLAEKYETVKRLSKQARKFLTSHDWPGNVREARRVAAMGFCMAEGNVIEIDDFADSLESRKEGEAEAEEIAPIHVRLFDSMVKDKKSFWEAMHEPFMQREYGREEIRNVIRKGLIQTRGSYRDLVELFNVEDDDYQKFMDFLRHQKLKPESVFSEKV